MNHSSAEPLPIAVLISGTGRSLRNLIDQQAAERLGAAIRLVVSSDPEAGGLAAAREAGIPAVVFQRKEFATDAAFSDAIFARLRAAQIELVVLAGFVKYLPIPPDFEHRLINIHPALVPAFCGKGYYGQRVHQAVLDYGAKVSGCTVHFVDNQYDNGPVILQRVVPVLDDDTPETLAARVFAAELEALPEAVRLIAAGRVSVTGRKVTIRPA